MKIKSYNGGYRATITINGKEYTADLRITLLLGIPEVTICQSMRGRITRYRQCAPAYAAWPDTLSADTLREHIALFAATNP